MSTFTFICKHCGPSEMPCDHAMQEIEIHLLRKIREEDRVAFRFIEGAIKDIIHILNRPQSATLRFVGGTMPATVVVGKTANSLFQEWTGPAGTGTVVPNAGAPAFSSDNPAVATVDPVSGVATGVSAGTANISGTDPVNGLSASDVLTVTPAVTPAVSATLVLTPN